MSDSNKNPEENKKLEHEDAVDLEAQHENEVDSSADVNESTEDHASEDGLHQEDDAIYDEDGNQVFYDEDGSPFFYDEDGEPVYYESEVDYTPVPGYDEDFYEDYYEGADPEKINENIRPSDQSDESAKLFSELQGVASVIRENARLNQNIKASRRHMTISIAVNLAFVGLLTAMVFAFMAYPKTRFIPTSDNRAICEVTPENNPNITDVAIADFAKDAVLNLYTFDYVNYEDQINSSLSRWFTAKGRVDTINAMGAAGITEFVRNNALTLRAGTTAAAKIEMKGRSPNGQPYWVVRFPMIVDVYSGAARPEDTQRYIVSVRVVADDASAQNPKGLGVASAALEPQG